MKAQVFRGVDQLSYEDVPLPEIRADEVLVQVRVVGLCQSDIKKIKYPLYEPPRIFGHETAGTIAAVGSDVQKWQTGDRVVVLHHIPCMHCAYCLNENFSMCEVYKTITTTAGFAPSGGGFAEYVKVPGHIVRNGGLMIIPDDVTFEQASFVEPTNCCLKAVKKSANCSRANRFSDGGRSDRTHVYYAGQIFWSASNLHRSDALSHGESPQRRSRCRI